VARCAVKRGGAIGLSEYLSIRGHSLKGDLLGRLPQISRGFMSTARDEDSRIQETDSQRK
jgi:hypothetical protein